MVLFGKQLNKNKLDEGAFKELSRKLRPIGF